MSLTARYRSALDHEREALRATSSSLETVPPTNRTNEDHAKALDLCAHLVESRARWLGRIRGEKDREADWFPKGWTRSDVARRSDEVYDAWSRFLDELTDAGLAESFRYTSWEGEDFENAVDDVLQQLHGHSFYHRGQIAQLVRRLGGRPAVTEYVLATRKRVED